MLTGGKHALNIEDIEIYVVILRCSSVCCL
jgi:hypothetical protein